MRIKLPKTETLPIDLPGCSRSWACAADFGSRMMLRISNISNEWRLCIVIIGPLQLRPHSIYKICKMESDFTAANQSWDRSDDKLLWCLAAMNQESAGGDRKSTRLNSSH